MFNCHTCVVADQIAGLAAENVRAWRWFQCLCSRFLMETRSVSEALRRLTADEDLEDYEDVLTRLAILYDVYYPPRREGSA